MRAEVAVRHHAAFGALLGLAVADSLGEADELPPRVCGQRLSFLPEWGAIAERALSQAEAAIRGRPVDIDLTGPEIAGAAVRIADDDAGPPLLTDPAAAAVCELVRAALDGRLAVADVAPDQALTPVMGRIVDAGAYAPAVESAWHDGCPPDELALTGAIAGLAFGPGSVPAAWATQVRGAVDGNAYRLRQVRRLAERLLRIDAPEPPEPQWRLGPREVAPKLWLSNLPAAATFTAAHPDGAVISLCPTRGRLDDHAHHREFAIHDQPGRRANPHLSVQLDEALATIEAFHAEGRDVLVHCLHGASRTGLVFRAWLMAGDGLSVDDATAEAQARWPKTSTWNSAFGAELDRRDSTR